MHIKTTGLGVAGLCNVGTPRPVGSYVSIDVRRLMFLPKQSFFFYGVFGTPKYVTHVYLPPIS